MDNLSDKIFKEKFTEHTEYSHFLNTYTHSFNTYSHMHRLFGRCAQEAAPSTVQILGK